MKMNSSSSIAGIRWPPIYIVLLVLQEIKKNASSPAVSRLEEPGHYGMMRLKHGFTIE